jgi:hypothetical protein
MKSCIQSGSKESLEIKRKPFAILLKKINSRRIEK